ALSFAEADPYVANGLVLRFRVRPWTTVVGPDAGMRLIDESPPIDLSNQTARSSLIAFLRGARHGVIASISSVGDPQAAIVGIAVPDGPELVFDPLDSTRKANNLRLDGRVGVVMTRGEATAQIEGAADEPKGDELERVREFYYDAFPDGRERATWPGITWFR